MTEQQIIEKIKKLLALTSSSNENEAARAMEHAQKLMERHCIATIPTDKPPEIEQIEWTCNINHIDAHTAYPFIAASILPIFGCYSLHRASKSGTIKAFGFSANLKIAKFALESVMNQGYAKYRVDYRNFRSLSFSSAFWGAFANSIHSRFEKQKETGNGLIIYDKVREEMMKQADGKASKIYLQDSYGYDAGLNAGREVELRKGITPKTEGRMLT